MSPRFRSYLVSILFTTVVLGCSDGADQPLRVRLDHFQLNLDPATIADIESRKIATLLYAGLVAVDGDKSVKPRLAESWRRIDALTWEFTLRKGVTFTDGSAANAKAVMRSLCWSMQPSHLYSWALSSIEQRKTSEKTVECTGLTSIGDDKLRIRESRPVPWLLEALDSPAGWIVGNPGEKPEAWGARPGIGPLPHREHRVWLDSAGRRSRGWCA